MHKTFTTTLRETLIEFLTHLSVYHDKLLPFISHPNGPLKAAIDTGIIAFFAGHLSRVAPMQVIYLQILLVFVTP